MQNNKRLSKKNYKFDNHDYAQSTIKQWRRHQVTK